MEKPVHKLQLFVFTLTLLQIFLEQRQGTFEIEADMF